MGPEQIGETAMLPSVEQTPMHVTDIGMRASM